MGDFKDVFPLGPRSWVVHALRPSSIVLLRIWFERTPGRQIVLGSVNS